MIKPYKFVSWEAGEKITIKDPKKFIVEHMRDMNIQKYGIYKLQGWAYDLRPYLKKFVYQQYDHWQSIYALNRTMVRYMVYGKVNEIVEIKR